MPVESATTIAELDASWPLVGDPTNEGDDHLRLTKDVLQKQFPGEAGQGFAKAITATEDDLNNTSGSISNFQDQIDALTAAVSDLPANVIGAIYPVGALYTSTLATDPATLLGVGTWSPYGTGKVFIGVDSGDPDFDAGGKTGGLKDQIVPTHSHVGNTASDGAHVHASSGEGFVTQVSAGGYFLEGGFPLNADTLANTASAGDHTHTVTVDPAGEDPTGKNLPPYITVYTWIRDA